MVFIDRSKFPYEARVDPVQLRRNPVRALTPILLEDFKVRKIPVADEEVPLLLQWTMRYVLPLQKLVADARADDQVTDAPYGTIRYSSPLHITIRLNVPRGRAQLTVAHELYHAFGFLHRSAWYRDEQVVHDLANLLLSVYAPHLRRVA